MIEVKGGKLTHNFQFLRSTNIRKLNLTRWGGVGRGEGRGVCPRGLAQIKKKDMHYKSSFFSDFESWIYSVQDFKYITWILANICFLGGLSQGKFKIHPKTQDWCDNMLFGGYRTQNIGG